MRIQPRWASLSLQTIFFLWLVAGAAIFIAPLDFYNLAPGIRLFGPFNSHFVRDVGLVYLASGLMGLAGHRLSQPQLYLWASLWSALHAVFHMHVWMHRGFPLDHIFLFDLFAVIAPPFFVGFIYWRLRSSKGERDIGNDQL